MAYGKIIVQGLVSENSDYSNPFIKTLSGAQTETPTKHLHQILSVPTTYAHLDFSALYGLNMGTVSGVVIHNRGATYNVLVVWYSLLETIANPGGSGITWASSGATVTDAAGSNKFANVEVGDAIICDNAEDSTNRGTRLVLAKASDNAISVTSTLDDDTGDTTATFQRVGFNKHIIKPGRSMVLPGEFADRTTGVDVPKEIYLQAQTGATECELFAFGS